MFRPTFLMLGALVVLSPATAKKPKFSPSTGQSATYACADGRTIEVLYSGGDAAVVTVAGSTVEMNRAVAANGERYVGGGWQWWGVGVRNGTLSRLGESEAIAAAPGTDCRVR